MRRSAKDLLACAREDARGALLLAWLLILLAIPFFAFPGRIGGASNAAACIAAGAGAVEVAARLRRPVAGAYVSRAAQACLMAVGVLALAPYAFFELGSIPWLLDPATETLTGYWPAPLDSALLFIGGALGYWPLMLSGGLCAIGLRAHRADGADDVPERPVPPALLAGAFLAGMLRQPLMPAAGDAPAHALIEIACACALSAAIVAGASREGGASAEILAHSLGVVAWNVLARVADLLGALPFDPLWASVPLAAATTALITWSATRNGPAEDSTEPEPQPAPAPRLPADALEGYAALTAAERSCIDLLAAGKTSAAIAEELGKSASTVRVLLGRAYKKLGVAGAAGLEAALAPEPAPPSRPAEPRSTPASPAQRSARVLAARAATLLVVAVPFPTAGVMWGAGRETYLPLALGLLCAGALALLPIAASPRDGGGPSRPTRARGGIVAATAAAGAASLACKILESAGVASGAIGPVSIVSSLVFGLGFAWGARPAGPSQAPRPATLRPADLPPLAIAASMGLGVEELWRGLGYFSILPQLMPLYALIAIGCLALLWQEDRRAAASVALVLAALLAALDAPRAIALCCLLACASSTVRLSSATHVLDPALPHLAPALGAGVLVGDVVVGTFADRLAFNDVALAYVGGQSGLLALGGFALGVAFCAVGAAAVAYCLRLKNDADAEGLELAGGAPAAAERALGYLTSRGLGDGEASVALLVAQGLSGREVSERLNYSMGAVNTLRRAAYAKLGVHSRRELISSISAATRDVN